MSSGTMHIEFCHYDENNCPWGYEYCSCKDFEDDNLDMTNIDDIDLSDLNADIDYPDDIDSLPF